MSNSLKVSQLGRRKSTPLTSPTLFQQGSSLTSAQDNRKPQALPQAVGQPPRSLSHHSRSGAATPPAAGAACGHRLPSNTAFKVYFVWV